MSLPLRGAWIEILEEQSMSSCRWSLPLRGAWIEIRTKQFIDHGQGVAPPAGSVD